MDAEVWAQSQDERRSGAQTEGEQGQQGQQGQQEEMWGDLEEVEEVAWDDEGHWEEEREEGEAQAQSKDPDEARGPRGQQRRRSGLGSKNTVRYTS